MKKILYIKASPRKERSKSIQVADEFIRVFHDRHPDTQIMNLDLFEQELPAFDGPVVQAKYFILHNQEHTEIQRRAWEKVEHVIERFKSADMYVMAVPMWNFSIPYRLKHYIDILVQPGYTFTSVENAYEGLVRNKPLVVVYSRGGEYSGSAEAMAFDQQKCYIEQIFGFMGFEDIRSIIVEPTLTAGAEAADIAIRNALENARELAKTMPMQGRRRVEDLQSPAKEQIRERKF